MVELIKDKLGDIIALCKEHKVIAISLFGSAVRKEMSNKSDLDFLIQFDPEIDILEYADNYFSFKEGLENITGREIDLITLKSIKNPVLRDEIHRSKIDLYAA